MDVFYEESAINANPKKGERIYNVTHIASMICLTIGVIMLILFLFNMPFGTLGADVSQEVRLTYKIQKLVAGFLGIVGLVFLVFWFILSKLKSRFNVSYDYCFVSGELRISKVINVNKRKLVARIDCQEMMQIGDIDNTSYERLKADPSIKEVICTPNNTAGEGKFFMYVLAEVQGKKMYILECREALLMNIMKFARRSTLESDYVMQEKKAKR